MGVSKNKKKKGKDGQKPKNVQQKYEKEKRLNEKESENNLASIFKTDEQYELKKILKTTSLTCMPVILGAVILGKFDLIKKLIKQGHDVNAVGHDKTTPLMWAVKCKNLEMIDLLVSRGADVTNIDDSGENIIFMALNSTDWDENCFLDFWQSAKKMADVNMEFANKTGNRILHFAVKRQWILLLESLIEDKVNINSCNNKGVSALTMAAAKNDLKLVNILLNAKANVFQEDLKGNTAICYTIVNIVRKNLKPSRECFERLTRNFSKEHYEQYIDRRLYLLISPPNNDLTSYYPNINRITTSVISFIIKQIPNGLDMLLKYQVFEKIKLAIESNVDHFEYLQALLSVLSLVLRWCDCCVKIRNIVPQNEISERFIKAEVADVLHFVLNVYNGSNSMKQLLPNVFLPLFLTCSQSILAKNWLKDHLEYIEEYYQQYLEICCVNFNIKEDDRHLQLLKERLKLFKETFEELKIELTHMKNIQIQLPITIPIIIEPVEEILELEKEEEKFEAPAQYGKKHAKRMRRKARALRARIDKIRSADVVERIKIHTKNKPIICIEEKEDAKEFIRHVENIAIPPPAPVVHPVILNEEIVHNFIAASSSNDSGFYDGTVRFYLNDKEFEKRKAEFGAALIRLKIMLNDIICKYKFLWALDSKMGHPLFVGGHGHNIHPLLEGSREEQLEKLKPLLPFIEQQYLAKLVENFNRTIDLIKNMFIQNNDYYKAMTEQFKTILSEYEIRGEKFLKNTFDKQNDEPYEQEVIPGKYGAIGDHLREDNLQNEIADDGNKYIEDFIPERYGPIGDHFHAQTDAQNIHPPTYMDLIENILPPKYPQPQNTISPQDWLYLNEMAQIPFRPSTVTKEEKEAIKKKTEEHAYHLVSDAYKICETDIFDGWDGEYITPYMKKMMQKAKEQKECFPIQRNVSTLATLKQDSMPVSQCNELVPYNFQEAAKPGFKSSRWESFLKQQLLNKATGESSSLLVVPSREASRCTLATGGNYGNVELTFDKNGRPLIIKRISTITISDVYACIQTVMSVKHRYILGYTFCSFDPKTQILLLGAPLCEYNLGEYVMTMKTQQTSPGVARSLSIQLLLGLQHLHRHKPEPILHGNLKPSNVLIDLRGKIRLAEFGLHQTLYIRDRPPKSSLIWFARETYETYEMHHNMQCTLATDMQVAGMLVHFTLTWGLHVFGGGADDILCNLMAGRPKVQGVGVDAADLISWMVAYQWCQRPSVGQVLNHIFFWSDSKRWRFMLSCSGLTKSGCNLPDLPLQRFHNYLDVISKQQGVIADWILIIKQQFPSFEEAVAEEEAAGKDTPIGVLKLIRRMVLEEREGDLKEVVLSGFPGLPLTLFRMVENSDWAKHHVFRSFFKN